MDVLIWLIILTLFALSFIGLFFPFLPSVLTIWGGFLLYHFLINASTLTWVFWVSMAALTILLLLADVLAGSMAVKRFGGSKLGERVATFSIIIGTFVYPPFGIILLPFIAVFIVEYWQKNTVGEASKAAAGSLIGFLSGRVAEGIIQFIMIIWFFLTIWL
ncbi:DUF456 domain-containing protein [Alkalibacterium sp.]|nr:MAG: DUF456 domain-containing protein [Alkalibacterium sp.]